MALIKCNECGSDMSDKAESCPNCGAENKIIFCPECGEKIINNQNICPKCGMEIKLQKNNRKKFIKDLILMIMLDIVGIISIFWGYSLSYQGKQIDYKYYGGDAYTGIQQAAADIGNNINELGKLICNGLKAILIVNGITTIIVSTNIFIKRKEQENGFN